MISRLLIPAVWLVTACHPAVPEHGVRAVDSLSLVVLGTVQDGGSPHIGCTRPCCTGLSPTEKERRRVVSLGLVDPAGGRRWLFEATPDIVAQLAALGQAAGRADAGPPDGIFLTHAHIGHYAGLMYLGKEAAGASDVPVHAMPRMKAFLETNAPWSLLVGQGNIRIGPMAAGMPVSLPAGVRVTPVPVPHRDELSETVAFLIEGPRHSALFLPDIDKWERWDASITAWIGRVDYALLDATFFDGNELKTRDISLVPHPFVIESLALFDTLPAKERRKIVFIHFNHTNPLLDEGSAATRRVLESGYRIARIGDVLPL